MKICGIYLWTNKVNGKKYVGASRNICGRWLKHEQNSNSGIKRKLYNATRKYGLENFDKEIIEEINSNKSDFYIKQREDYFIDFYNSIKEGYNVEKGYNTITYHPEKNRIINQISEKAKNRKWINNGEKQITCDVKDIQDFLEEGWVFGRLPFSDDHIKQLSNSHKGHKLTQKQKDAWCPIGGRPHSKETKKIMSKKTMGRYTLKWYIEKYGKEKGIVKYKNHHNKPKGKNICVTKNKINKIIDKNKLNLYLDQGWKRGKYIKYTNEERKKLGNGNRGKIWISNEFNESKTIYPKDLKQYEKNNWKKGRLWKKK